MKRNIIKKIGMVVGMGLLLGMIQACCFPFHHPWHEHPDNHRPGHYSQDNPPYYSPKPGPYR